MNDDIDEQISRLRKRLDAETDADLARKLRVDKSTVSSWRSRGSLPARIQRILSGEDKQPIAAPPLHWSDYEQAAFALALFRYSRFTAQEMANFDLKKAVSVFSRTNWQFWLIFNECQIQLVKYINMNDGNIEQARIMLMHADIEEPDAAKARTQALLLAGRDV